MECKRQRLRRKEEQRRLFTSADVLHRLVAVGNQKHPSVAVFQLKKTRPRPLVAGCTQSPKLLSLV